MLNRTCLLFLHLIVVCGVATAEPLSLGALSERAGINPDKVGISLARQKLLGAEGILPLVQLLLSEPLSAPNVLEPIAGLLLKNTGAPAALFARTTVLAERNVYRRSSVDQLIARESPDGQGLEELLQQLTGRNEKKLLAKWPIEFRQSLFVILYAQLMANNGVMLAQEQLPPRAEMNLWSLARISDFDFNSASPARRQAFWRYRQAINSFDPNPLIMAAEEIVYAVQWAVEYLGEIEPNLFKNVSHTFQTPYGAVVIGGTRNDQHSVVAPLLIIDLGGDDLYTEGGANDPSKQATSVLVDLSGNDFYQGKKASFGSGTFGIGVAWDESGDDRYETLDRSIGSAHFGVGVLVDRNGNDTYAGRAETQGSAVAGVAMLFDGNGDDRYDAMLGSQGFGGPRGVATLIDSSGNDTYTARNANELFPSSQSVLHSSSLSQGMGFGIRADLIDGFSIPGGIGLLLDGTGNDSYQVEIFGQGAAYWFGAGILIDGQGDDRYRAHWYGQGISAHFSSGVLIDGEGDDYHLIEERMGLGAAHDLGTAVFADNAGNDSYNVGDLALGASSAAGNAVFLDRSGDDTYLQRSPKSVGWIEPNSKQDLRSAFPAYGLFFDLNGTDRHAQDYEERFLQNFKDAEVDASVSRRSFKKSKFTD